VDLVDEIKTRLDIVEVVSQYVELKKAGKNYKGLCPFHSEKTPSFIVSPEKQIAWCFGCQKGGDVFNFLQEVENVDFVEARNMLAEKANIDVSKYQVSSSQVSKSEKEEMINAHDVATRFFIDQLFNSLDGKKALEYIRERGISDEMINLFQLGWAPDSFQDTYSYLLKNGVSKDVIVRSGLATSKDTAGTKIFDRFHGRIMFPVSDSLGRIVAFAGRAVKSGQEPKYLNSAETKIYNKSALLYGYSQNKKAIKTADQAIVVEGYFDVIASVQVGVENVVASSGTALTKQHVQLLKRLTRNLVFAFDSDKAGIDAARRGVEMAQSLDVNVKVAVVSGGKDAADLVKDTPEEWARVIARAKPYLEFFVKYRKDEISDDDPDKLRKVLDDVFPLLAGINGRIELDGAVRMLAKELNLRSQLIYDDLQNIKLPSTHPVKFSKSRDIGVINPKRFDDFEHLLGLIVSFPESINDFQEEIKNVCFQGKTQNIYNNFLRYYNPSRLEFDKDSFFAHLSNDEKKEIDVLTLYIEHKYKEFSFDNIRSEVGKFIARIGENSSRLTRQQLQEQLRKAEEEGDMDQMKYILEQIQKTY